jgi:hypothetical protein
MRSEKHTIVAAITISLLTGSAVGVAAQGSLATDLLPGVDLVTEEVEPGVHRVMSDGLRDLSRTADDEDRYLGGILDGNIVAGLEARSGGSGARASSASATKA